MPIDSMHVILHRGHCLCDGMHRLTLAEAMSTKEDGKRVVFACHKIRFALKENRSCGSSGDPNDFPAVAVGFITCPPNEPDWGQEILEAIEQSIKEFGMKLLLGVLPLDEEGELRDMLGRMDCKQVFYQPMVADGEPYHYPLYIAAFGHYKVSCSELLQLTSVDEFLG